MKFTKRLMQKDESFRLKEKKAESPVSRCRSGSSSWSQTGLATFTKHGKRLTILLLQIILVPAAAEIYFASAPHNRFLLQQILGLMYWYIPGFI